MKKTKHPMYTLFHVNKKTGEKVPFRNVQPVESKQEMETRALDIRVGIGRGTAYQSVWTVESGEIEQ